jgi:hypothetical protein
VPEGAPVVLTATPDDGYRFGRWMVEGADGPLALELDPDPGAEPGAESFDATFIMPASDVWVSVEFVMVKRIVFATSFSGNKSFLVAGHGEATIDWGDGTEPQTVTLNAMIPREGVGFQLDEASHAVRHSYMEAKMAGTVIVTGENITGFGTNFSGSVTDIDTSHMPSLINLECSTERLTAIDVSGNPALADLRLYENRLTSLDLSANPVLYMLAVFSNNINHQALVATFESLPDNSERMVGAAEIYCGDNPGYAELTDEDKKITADKGWNISYYYH